MTGNLGLKKLFFAVPALMLLLLGCGPDVQIKDVDTTSRPPNTGQLDIYNAADEIKRPYKMIKLIRVEDNRVAKNQDEEQMKQRAIAKAKESGAEGIIIKKTGTRNYRVPDGMGGSVAYNAKFMDIEAIVYTDK